MANIIGTSGDDILVQNAGQDDEIDGGAGSDTLDLSSMGEAARLFLALSTGQMIGSGQGTDTIRNVENAIGTAFDDLIVGVNGGSVLYGGDGKDQLQGRGGDDDLNGYIGDDLLIGNAGNDVLFGSSGKDVLRGGLGHNSLDGSSGFDRADYSRMGEGVSVSLIAGTADPVSGNGSFHDELTSIEEINASPFDDVIYGDASVNRLFGLGGDDYIDAGLGNDTLSGGAGDDIVIGGGGRDYVLGGHGNDTLITGLGRTTAVGEEGVDTVDYSGFNRPDGMFINIESRRAFFNDGSGDINDRLYEFENVVGTDGADTIIGNAEQNQLVAGAGNDYLDGKDGDDDLQGGDGDDTIIGRTGNDLIQGGHGDDYLRGDEGDDVLFGGAGLDTLVGAAGDDLIHIAGSGFAGIYGGDGIDALVLDGSAVTLDLSALPVDAVSDVEYFHLGGRGNTLALNQSNVAALGGQVYVQGDASDTLSFLDAGWAAAGAVQVDGVPYDLYQRGASEVRVQAGVQTDFQISADQLVTVQQLQWHMDGSGSLLVDFTYPQGGEVSYSFTGPDGRTANGTTQSAPGGGSFTVQLPDIATASADFANTFPVDGLGTLTLTADSGQSDSAQIGLLGTPTQQNLYDGEFQGVSFDGSKVVVARNGQIELLDLATGVYETISQSASGVDGNGASTNGSISWDGRYVAFESAANNLVAGDTNGKTDVFLMDRQTGALTRVTNDGGTNATVTNDGTKVFYQIGYDHHIFDIAGQVSNPLDLEGRDLEWMFADTQGYIHTTFETTSNGQEDVYTTRYFFHSLMDGSDVEVYTTTESRYDFAGSSYGETDYNLVNLVEKTSFENPDSVFAFERTHIYYRYDDFWDPENSTSSTSTTYRGVVFSSSGNVYNLSIPYNLVGYGQAFALNNLLLRVEFLRDNATEAQIARHDHNYGTFDFYMDGDGSETYFQFTDEFRVRGDANLETYQGDAALPNYIVAEEYAAHLIGGNAPDLLVGSEKPDILVGHEGNDVLIGNGGNDRFEPGLNDGETDVIKGGDGADRIVAEGYVSSADPSQGVDIQVTSPGAGTVHDLATGTHLLASFESIEALFGTGVADRMINNSATGLSMFGNDGDDELTGGGGVDLVNGGAGDDVLDAGGGNDRSVGGAGQDRFVLGDGTDRLLDFTQGDDVLDITALGLTDFAQVQAQLSASSGGAIFSHAGGTTQFIGIDVNNLTQDDFYFFRVGDDTLTGTPNAETLDGFHGDDIIFGEGGADILLGSAGDDTIHVPDLGFARIDGGAGVNDKLVLQGAGQTLDLPAIDDTLLTNVERFDLTGGGANQINVDESEVAHLGGLIKINGTGADTLFFSQGIWSLQGTTQEAGILYDVFAQNGQTIWAEQGMMVDSPPPVLNVTDWVWDADGSGRADVYYTSSSNEELTFRIENADGQGHSFDKTTTPVNGKGVLSLTVEGPQRPWDSLQEFDPVFGLAIEYEGAVLQQGFNTGVATTKVELDGVATSVSDDGDLVTADYLTRFYLYDLANQTSIVVSKADDGFVYSGSDGYITPSGSHVAFNSNDNLVPHDTGTTRDVFVYDVALDQTVRASEQADGTALGSTSTFMAMSDDGNQVWFRSTGGIYRKTMDTGQLDLMTSANLIAAPDGSNFGYIQNSELSVESGDDEIVTYTTSIYLVDLQTGDETVAYTQSETRTLGQGDSASISGSDLELSRDGNFASFEGRSNIDASFHQDVSRHTVVDLGAGTMVASSSGSQSAQRGDFIVTNGGVAYDGQGGFVYRPIESFASRPVYTDNNFLYGTGGPFFVDGDASSLFVNKNGVVRVRGDVQREIFQGITGQPNYLKADISAADMRGGDENDLLLGSPQNDLLAGGGGNDVLYGHEGDDVIDGGAGDDHITAGAGVDRIVVSDGTDQLTDFTQADDVLDVSHAGYADFATVQANLSDAASGAILSHAGGSIQLTGIGIAMLDATDFVYA